MPFKQRAHMTSIIKYQISIIALFVRCDSLITTNSKASISFRQVTFKTGFSAFTSMQS
ncbi:unnamed protein product [Paramecium pentaurelia]|uniref:Uncharacterized protein n=1 Tax=Paramecium pentaurelia TaxID=43138 RepID=A0A8S1YKB6_9CILI|nr:unnamed protein product [Paramecium pentaurelia]